MAGSGLTSNPAPSLARFASAPVKSPDGQKTHPSQIPDQDHPVECPCQPHTYRLDQNLNLRQQNYRHQASDGHRSAHSTHPSAMTVHSEVKLTQSVQIFCDPAH